MSSIANVSRPLGMSVSCRESIGQISSIVSEEQGQTSLTNETGVDTSDDVFFSDISGNYSLDSSREQNGVFSSEICKACDKKSSRDRHCSECQSHLKVPSRQEKITDDTPQMHRTDESVWNSYAAKNLSLLRCGLYSEDSDGDGNKENEQIETTDNSKAVMEEKDSIEKPTVISQSTFLFTQNTLCDSKHSNLHKARRLRKTKSFCYPSDEEDSDLEFGRFTGRKKFAQKRSFCDVLQSPVRRTQSADSGLTAEFRLLRCNNGEPLYKRSNSLPRTRIRFHSGHKTTSDLARETPKSLLNAESPSDTQKCLNQIAAKCKELSDSDNMTTLSADEKRLVEGHSDTSMSEQDSVLLPESTDIHDSLVEDNCDMETSVVENHTEGACNDPSLDKIVKSSDNTSNIVRDTKPMNKALEALKHPLVSSINSEGEVKGMSLNISSIHDDEEKGMSDMDVSVFSSAGERCGKQEEQNG